MDSFEKPIFTDIAVPRDRKVNVADFLFSSPWGDCDLAFTWSHSDFNAPHTHNHWELFIIVEGTVVHSLNGKEYSCERGDAQLIRPADLHSFSRATTKDYQQINFLIKSDFLQRYFNVYDETLYTQLESGALPLKFKLSEPQLQSLFYKMLALQTVSDTDNIEQNVFHAKVVFSSLIQAFFEQNFSEPYSAPAWLKNLLNELNKPGAYLLTASEITRLTPFSYSRLAYLFKKYTNKTLNNYMLNLKLLHAQDRLRFTNLTTLEICSEIGFSSLSHFNHIFKKTFQITPSHYRAQFKSRSADNKKEHSE